MYRSDNVSIAGAGKTGLQTVGDSCIARGQLWHNKYIKNTPSEAEEAIHAALWDYAQKNGIKIEGLEQPKENIGEEEEEEEY